MAKTGRKPRRAEAGVEGVASPQKETATTATKDGRARPDGESVAGYFRRVFGERPDLLDSGSNAKLLDRWLEDHPGHGEVPTKVKQSLSNIKSVLRRQRRENRKGKAAGQPAEVTADAPAAPAAQPLEILEEQIDECLALARKLGREDLANVVRLLRGARNAVVWKLGM